VNGFNRVSDGEAESLAAAGDTLQVEPAAQKSASDARLYFGVLKRLIDFAIVTLTAPFWIPLVIICAVSVAFDGHNPFFVQKCLGRTGRVFHMFKLRTMMPDAERILAAHSAEDASARAEWEVSQELHDDPRVTRFGRFLRSTSLDEVPKFVNVLIGDMSLVGPRPIMVTQENLYPGRQYYQMRPGITGLWQVSARNSGAFSQRATYDDAYFEQASFATDLRVVLQSLQVMVKRAGC
jgi:exopolysaccharide production protein ExoY